MLRPFARSAKCIRLTLPAVDTRHLSRKAAHSTRFLSRIFCLYDVIPPALTKEGNPARRLSAMAVRPACRSQGPAFRLPVGVRTPQRFGCAELFGCGYQAQQDERAATRSSQKERGARQTHKRLLNCVNVTSTSLDHLLLGMAADGDQMSHAPSIPRFTKIFQNHFLPSFLSS